MATQAEKMYRCYYPHQSRDLVSPVCGIFLDVVGLVHLDSGSELIMMRSLTKTTAVQMYKYLHLHLPVHLHLEVSLVDWPMELLLTHYLQTV